MRSCRFQDPEPIWSGVADKNLFLKSYQGIRCIGVLFTGPEQRNLTSESSDEDSRTSPHRCRHSFHRISTRPSYLIFRRMIYVKWVLPRDFFITSPTAFSIAISIFTTALVHKYSLGLMQSLVTRRWAHLFTLCVCQTR